MSDSKRETYEKCVEKMRTGVVIVSVICGVAMAFTCNTRLVIVPVIGFMFCVVFAVVLALEYLIRLTFFRSGRKLHWYQFSLSGMLVFTTLVGVTCTWLNLFGYEGVGWLILTLTSIAGILETFRKRSN